MRLFLAVALSVSALPAYTPWMTSSGVPLHRTDAANIQYLVNQSTAAGMKNADGNMIITADSDPMKALQAAANAWSSVSTAAVRFQPLQTTSAVNDQSDNRHVIVFLDTPENRSVIGSALAVTVASFFSDGNIVDADILFNPALRFRPRLRRTLMTCSRWRRMKWATRWERITRGCCRPPCFMACRRRSIRRPR